LQQEVTPTLKTCTCEKITYQEFAVFFHKAYLTFSTSEQETSSLKPAGVFPLCPEMIKEIYFEKNYTEMNKKGCYGESRQNKSVATKVHTNTCLNPKCNLPGFFRIKSSTPSAHVTN